MIDHRLPTAFLLIPLLVMAVSACQPALLSPTAGPTSVFPAETAATPGAPAATATRRPSATPVPLSDGEFLNQPLPGILRVMSYNINWDSIFPDDDRQNHEFRSANREEEFVRLVAAIQPDVLCLQEVNSRRDPQQAADLLTGALGGPAWNAVGARDTVILSRYPLATEGYALGVVPLPLDLLQAAARVDLPDAEFGSTDLYLICAHFKSGGGADDIALRQRQADVITHELVDARTPGDAIDLPPDTPILVLGDFNVYDTDPAAHLDTLLTGDIFDEERYGADSPPDWDGTALADAQPSLNAQGLKFYTWRDDSGNFRPGALDRILFTDSVLALVNAFVLDTTRLSEDALAEWGLQAADVLMNGGPGYYDHLPLVADFEFVSVP
ncbi:MAG: endonuclease/exonuclease/phosphatase family protein [Chloroflexi bacterium]|nr:endonuclease/exonuclease/phosphatase family protein [Chloroflexota bacterium]